MSSRATISRERLFAAADRALERHGYARITMNDIAEQAGVSRASLYRFFKTKEDLFAAQTRLWVTDLEAKLHSVLERECSCTQKVESIIRTSVTHLTEKAIRLPNITREYFYDIRTTFRWIEPAHALCRKFLTKAIDEGVHAAEFKKSPPAAQGAALGLLVELLQMHVIATSDGTASGESAPVTTLLTLVLRGLTP